MQFVCCLYIPPPPSPSGWLNQPLWDLVCTVYHGTWVHFSGIFHKTFQPVCVSLLSCIVYFYFICNLLNEATSNSEFIGSNDRTIAIHHLKKTTGAKPAFSWRDWGNPRKIPIRIGNVPAPIGTEHLLNTNQKRYRLSHLARVLTSPTKPSLIKEMFT
jgi:hypothetical protein